MTVGSIQENPYESRVLDERKNNPHTQSKKPSKIVKKVCPKCKKGFNKNSNYVECRGCDSWTHVKCISKEYDEESFMCKNVIKTQQIKLLTKDL